MLTLAHFHVPWNRTPGGHTNLGNGTSRPQVPGVQHTVVSGSGSAQRSSSIVKRNEYEKEWTLNKVLSRAVFYFLLFVRFFYERPPYWRIDQSDVCCLFFILLPFRCLFLVRITSRVGKMSKMRWKQTASTSNTLCRSCAMSRQTIAGWKLLFRSVRFWFMFYYVLISVILCVHDWENNEF